MDAGEVLPSFSGIVMHDGWKSYDAYADCRHVLGVTRPKKEFCTFKKYFPINSV
nr:hypothetical protein [Bacillus thuringiensis]